MKRGRKLKDMVIITIEPLLTSLTQMYKDGLMDKSAYGRIFDKIIRIYNDSEKIKYCSKTVYDTLVAVGFDFNITNGQLYTKNIEGSNIIKFKNTHNLMPEHMVPINDLREAYLKDEITATDVMKKAKVCWISNDEDERLRKAGYRDHRPNGWEVVYKECNIEAIAVK